MVGLPEIWGGIELSEEPVQLAKGQTPNVEIYFGDTSELPKSNYSFNLVCYNKVYTSILNNYLRQHAASDNETSVMSRRVDTVVRIYLQQPNKSRCEEGNC